MIRSKVNEIKDKVAHLSRHNFLLHREIKKLQHWETLSDEDYLKKTIEKATDMIRHARSQSSFYRELYKSVNFNAPFEELYASLPQITKSDMRAKASSIATTSLRFLKKAYTSGTSGSPLTVYRSPRSIIIEEAHMCYWRLCNGLNIGDPVISMRGVLDRNTLHYYNKAENILYLSSYLLSKKNIHQYAELITEFRPKALWAFPSSAFNLVNLLQDAGTPVNIPLVFTSSETLYPFQREKIENSLNAKIYDRYGNAERTIALAQCEHYVYHNMPIYSVNEFTDKGVITTSLINNAFPLIRYYIDDGFEKMDTACPCGRGTGIRSMIGRVDDVVILPDGTHVGRLGVAFQGVKNLQYAQIIQDEKEKIGVNLVVDPAFSQADEQFLLNRLRQRLNDSLIIVFHRVEEKDIIKTRSNKFKLVISRLFK